MGILPAHRVHAKRFSIKLSCTMMHVRPLKFKVVWENEGEESLLFQSLFPDWNQKLRSWDLYKFDMGTRLHKNGEEVKRTVPPSTWDSNLYKEEDHQEDFYGRLMLDMDLDKAVS